MVQILHSIVLLHTIGKLPFSSLQTQSLIIDHTGIICLLICLIDIESVGVYVPDVLGFCIDLVDLVSRVFSWICGEGWCNPKCTCTLDIFPSKCVHSLPFIIVGVPIELSSNDIGKPINQPLISN